MNADTARNHWWTAVSTTSRTEPIQALETCSSMAFTVDDITRDSVDRARRAGQTWEEIGTALRISKQAAQQRFG